MTLFRRERRDATVQQEVDFRGLGRSRLTTSGQVVNDDRALQLSAVWGCVDLLSTLVSTLPIAEYRKIDGVRKVQTTPALLEDPAGDGTGFEVWLRQLITSCLLRGNAYGLIERIGPDGWPVQISSLHPDRITWRRERNLGPVTSFLDNEPILRWPLGPLWHLPVYVTPGSPIGMSPIQYAANTIGLGLAAQRFGAGWFDGGGLPIGTLESDQIIDADTAVKLKERVRETMRPGEPLVLGAGLKFNAIQVNPEDSQFLETSKANADDIARFFFRRPPGEGGAVTYANVEARSLDLLTYTLTGWLVPIEKALTRLRPRPRYVKFNADALVRVDLAGRYKAHDIAIRSGLNSRDERRELEEYGPIPDGTGGEFLWPPYATALAPDPADMADPNDPNEGGDTNDGPA
jgi:HK97 family phage portal protein